MKDQNTSARYISTRALLPAILALILILGTSGDTAQAATFTVTNTNDNGPD